VPSRPVAPHLLGTLALAAIATAAAAVAVASTMPGTVRNGQAWTRSSLSVCYATAPDQAPIAARRGGESVKAFVAAFGKVPPAERAEYVRMVRETLAGSAFTSSSGIALTGWRECAPDVVAKRSSDVVLVVLRTGDVCKGAATVGPVSANPAMVRLDACQDFRLYLEGKSWMVPEDLQRIFRRATEPLPALQARIAASSWNHEALLQFLRRASVLHEFGHVLGMDHEYVRQPLPRRLPFAEMQELGEEELDAIQTFKTPYDPASIMMYGTGDLMALLALARTYCGSPEDRALLLPKVAELCPRLLAAELRAEYSSLDQYVLRRHYGGAEGTPPPRTPLEDAQAALWNLLSSGAR
jgi:hypothetical protein